MGGDGSIKQEGWNGHIEGDGLAIAGDGGGITQEGIGGA